MTQRSMSQRWRATTLPYLTFRGLGQAAEFVGWVLLARRLGTASFGELSVAVLICRYGGLIADWGASIRGVRDVADGRSASTIRALNRRRMQTTAGLSIVYVAGAIAVGQAALVPLVVMLIGIGLNRDWIALGDERGGRSALPTTVQGLLLVAVALVGPVGRPALAPAIAYGAGLLLSIALNRLPAAEPGGVSFVDGWMLLAVISNQVLSSADTLLLAAMVSASAAGIYAAVYRVPNGWLALLVIIRGGLLPLATKVLREDHQQFLSLRRSSLKWSLLSALSLVAVTPVAFVLIPVIFGPDYRSGQWPAVLLLLATAVATAAAPLHHLFLAFGDDRPYAGYLLGAAVLNVAVNLVAIPVAGLMGAAVATVIANVFLGGVLWFGLNRRIATLPDRAPPPAPAA